MSRVTRLLFLLIPALLAVALYGYVLRLPLFLDDGILYAMIRDYGPTGVPGLRFWGGSLSYQYYRPLGFSVLEILHGLNSGRLDPVAAHSFNLGMFVIAAALVTAFVRRLTRSAAAGGLSGLIFVLIPFSFRVVTWVATLFHAMVVVGLLLALYFSLIWLDQPTTAPGDTRRSSLLPLVGAWFGAFFALFSQENAIFLLPLLLALIVIRYGWRTIITRPALLVVVPVAGLTGVFLALFFGIPRPASGPLTLHPDMLSGSLAVFFQSFIYPVAALVRRLTMQDARTLPLLALAAGMIVTGLVLAWSAGRQRMLAAGFGLAWFTLMALPASLLLTTDYLKGSPHIFFSASAGTAIFWGAALAAALEKRRQQRVTPPLPGAVRLLAAGVAVGLILVGVWVSDGYLAARRMETLRQADYTWKLLALIQANPESTLLINPPAFLSAKDEQRYFLTTSEATMFLDGSYTNHAQIFEAMTGTPFPRIDGLVFEPLFVPPPDYVFAPYWTDVPADFTAYLVDFSRIYVTVFDGSEFDVQYVGGSGLRGTGVPVATVEAVGLTLTRATAELADSTVTIRTRWQVEQPVEVHPVITIACNGAVIAQSTQAVWGGIHPFSVWLPGEIQSDVRTLSVPADAARDCLQVTVGVRAADSADLLPLRLADGRETATLTAELE